MIRRTSVRTRLEITALLALIVVVGVIIARRPPLSEQTVAPSIPSTTSQMMTLDPQIIANLTEFPKATPLAGQAANDLTALRALVDACPDYDTSRRQQMEEQIQFIINPSVLPAQVLIALGTDPPGKLLYAVANLNKVQWQLIKSPADSCLIPIGKRLNQLLVADNQSPISAFEGG
ncbi:MAG: hypothetical protein ABI700_15120 [Chloroflexota bacterium]